MCISSIDSFAFYGEQKQKMLKTKNYIYNMYYIN